MHMESSNHVSGSKGDLEYMACNVVDKSYVPKAREVKLDVNTSLHQQHAQQSQAAMQQPPPKTLRTNLVVVVGQPLWYSSHDLVSCHSDAASMLLIHAPTTVDCAYNSTLCTRVEL